MVGNAVVITRIIPRTPPPPPWHRRFANSNTVRHRDTEPDCRAFGYTFPDTLNLNGGIYFERQRTEFRCRFCFLSQISAAV
jgi:hypothetical protein